MWGFIPIWGLIPVWEGSGPHSKIPYDKDLYGNDTRLDDNEW